MPKSTPTSTIPPPSSAPSAPAKTCRGAALLRPSLPGRQPGLILFFPALSLNLNPPPSTATQTPQHNPPASSPTSRAHPPRSPDTASHPQHTSSVSPARRPATHTTRSLFHSLRRTRE